MAPEQIENLIQRYLNIVATDDYADFGSLLTDDCTFSLMPIGHTVAGRQEIMAFVEMAGGSRSHDERSQVVVNNWFTDGRCLCVEYEHTAIVKPLRLRIKIDGYCWVFQIRDGKFDAIREYINPSHPFMSFLLAIMLRFLPMILRRKTQRDRATGR